MTMEKSAKGVKNLANATEVPRNCDAKSLFPSKGRYQSCNKTSEMHSFLKFIFGTKLYIFRTVSLSTIRSLALYTQQTPDDRQRYCPKHVQFYSKNKFEKSVHLVGFNTRIYHDARSSECQIWRYHTRKTAVLTISGLRCGCEL